MRGVTGGVLVVALLVTGLGLALRGSLEPPAEFTFVNGTEPRTLDPGLVTGHPEGRIVDAIFEGLVVRDPQTLRPRPGVAERWEISSDGRRYVFSLRENARWSDGRRVTAQDFAWSWRRLLDPATGGEYAYLLHGLRGARAWNTHAAQAEALEGLVLQAFDALRASHPQGVDAPRWERFLREHDLLQALEGARDTEAVALREVHSVSSGDWRRLRAGLLALARRKRASAADAALHFGVDRGVYARDEATLVVELVAPIPYFLQLCAFYPTYPVPRHLVELPGNALDWYLPRKIVSNGPFALERWRVGDYIRLRRSEVYWDRERIALSSVDALPIENANTALNLYASGEVDWISHYPVDLARELRKHPDYYSNAAFYTYFYRLNTREPPLSDRRVRWALALAIDREQIVREVLGRGELPAHHFVPPGLEDYVPPPSRLRFDPEAAREKLAAAGFPGGEGFPELGILYNTLESHKKVAEVIADQLQRHLGIRVVPYNQEWQAYLASIDEGDYQLARAGWVGDYLDPNTFLDLWITDGGHNQSGWGDPHYDRLVELAADVERFVADPSLLSGLDEPERAGALRSAVLSAATPELRRAAGARLRMHLLREAEAILVRRALPFIPIYFSTFSGLVRPEVEGFYSELLLEDGRRVPNLQDLHPLRGIRMGTR